MFICNKCGECCRHLNMNPIYQDLDRGDGICKFLDGNLCSIYHNRPLKCRVDEAYEIYFKDDISKSDYYALNRAACIMFQKTVDKREPRDNG